MTEYHVPQSVVNEVEKLTWEYKIRAENAVKKAIEKFNAHEYKKRGYEYRGEGIIIQDDC